MRNTFLLLLITSFAVSFGQKRDIELTDIWASGTFFPKTLSGFVSLNDGKSYCIQETDDKGNSIISTYNYLTGDKTGELINAKDVFNTPEGATFSSYSFSKDQTRILLNHNSEAIYRHSTVGEFVVVDLKGNIRIGNSGGKKVRYPTMSPQGDKVAYVMNNDLYVLDMITHKTRRITKDGTQNSIINGAVDWVYEEEFSMSRGFEWNSDGTKIAFYKFNETAVKEWDMTIYGDLYPEQYKYKYPKAGEANSVVQVWITDMKGKFKEVELGSENDQYLPRIKWTNNPNVLTVQRLNRLQNKWELLLVNDLEVSQSLVESNKTYIDITDDIYFLKDGRHMIVSSEQDGNKHLYFHKVEGPQIYQITNGNWEVDEVLGIDEVNEKIYFTSTEVSPTERHIFSINFQGKDKTQITTQKGWHTAEFNSDFTLALHSFSTANTPHSFVIRNADWTLVRELETNTEFNQRMDSFELSKVTFDTLLANGVVLNYWMIKPNDFDPSKKYPLLMYVYGGPGSQTVKNSFGWSNNYWYQMLANKYNIIIASVDNRGTGARGAEFKKMTYKELGKYETEDQIAAAKVLRTLPGVDSSRIGIWGWSYGGYMSSLCLAKGNDVFKMAIAVAPVTNWRFYDNIYTERYMGLPKDNAAGYDSNSPINFVKDIKGDFLIIHGTGDDNVHFENTAMMVNEMVKNNISFDSEFYPNKNHGIYGGYTRLHLYNKMTNFILDNL